MKKRIICAILAILMLLALCSCGSGTTPETSKEPAGSKAPAASGAPAVSGEAPVTTGKKPEVITIGVNGWLGRFLDGAEPSPNLHACDAVYDSLFLIDTETAEPYSFILEDWGYEDDLTFKMTLKPGITFTNGDVATADDLLFSIAQHVERGDINVISLGPIDLEKSTSDGDRTVTIKYKEPYGPGLYTRNLYLFDKAWCKEKGWDSQDWYSNPNGTGPYKCTEYVTDDHITLELKDNYWNSANEKFDVKKWIIKYFPDASTMYMALEKGDVSMCGIGNTSDYERLLSEGSDTIAAKVASMGGNLTCFVGPNNNEIFKDINVRKAIAHGVDWQAMGQMIQGQRYTQPKSILVPGCPYYIETGAYEYDPELARKTLADAGYKDGDLKIHMYMMSTGATKTAAEAFQFYCSEMGIKCELEFGDVTSVLQIWMADGGSDVGFYNNINGIPNCEPHESLNCFYIKGFTWCLSDNQAVKDKFLAAINTIDSSKRAELYKELQQICHDEYLMFPVCEDSCCIGYRTDVFTKEEIDRYTYSSSYYLLHQLSLAR